MRGVRLNPSLALYSRRTETENESPGWKLEDTHLLKLHAMLIPHTFCTSADILNLHLGDTRYVDFSSTAYLRCGHPRVNLGCMRGCISQMGLSYFFKNQKRSNVKVLSVVGYGALRAIALPRFVGIHTVASVCTPPRRPNSCKSLNLQLILVLYCQGVCFPPIPYSMLFRIDEELRHKREIARITPKCSHNY